MAKTTVRKTGDVHTILNHKDLTGLTVGVREGQNMAKNCPILPLIAPYFDLP